MKDLKTPNEVAVATNFSQQLSAIMPRQNGTPAGLAALQASLLRGKGLVK